MPDKVTPNYWRNRAKEVRSWAEQMTDPQIRKTLLRSAQDYEMLAKRAEERWALKRVSPIRALVAAPASPAAFVQRGK
jgi:hypothetical protein